jgi:hypothetical protein
MELARKKSATLSALVVPSWTQTGTPSSSSAETMAGRRSTMKPWPSWKVMPAKSSFRPASRSSVQVELRESRSMRPAASASKRSVAESGT